MPLPACAHVLAVLCPLQIYTHTHSHALMLAVHGQEMAGPKDVVAPLGHHHIRLQEQVLSTHVLEGCTRV